MAARRVPRAGPTLIGALVAAAASSVALAAGSLTEAASSNDHAQALAALEAGADPNARAADGSTPLLWAVYYDDQPLIEALLAAGADADAANAFGATPLGEAAKVGNASVVAALLDAGVGVDERGADGQTALMIAARGGHLDVARLLLERGAAVDTREAWRGQTALMWAAAQGHPELVALLLEHGADANARASVNHWERQVTAEPRRMYRPFGGLTPLLLAAREGCAACVERLLDGGADPDLADPKNVTPLFVAIDNLNFDAARELIEGGASPNKWDWWGRTPLYAAVDVNTIPHGGRADLPSLDATSSLDIVALLLEAGANPNVQLKLIAPFRHIGDDRGCDLMLTTGATPLLRAAKTFDAPAMRLLIDAGALLDLPNQAGITPLMAASGYGSVECDPHGYGPGIPHYVTADVEQKAIAALDVLLDAGARVDAATSAAGAGANDAGQTALFGAAFWGWNDVVSHLVAHGARIDATDASGRTPLDAALGRTAGHGRGQTIETFADTADLLESLCAEQAGCDLAAAR